MPGALFVMMPLGHLMPMWPADNQDSQPQVRIDSGQDSLQQYSFVFVGATARCCAGFGQGTGQIVLDQVNCAGTETSLFNCPANPIGTHDCTHSEDVGITCRCECRIVPQVL